MTWSAHLSMNFREFPYLDCPRAAAEAGFGVVETWWPPGDLAERWVEEIRRLDLDVACVNAYGGDLEAGERGFLNEPERRAEALAAFRGAAELDVHAFAPTLDEAGSTGAIGLEFDPGASTEEALGFLRA